MLMTEEHVYNESDLDRNLTGFIVKGGRLGYGARRVYQIFTPGCQRYVGGIKTVRRIVSHSPDTGFEFSVPRPFS